MEIWAQSLQFVIHNTCCGLHESNMNEHENIPVPMTQFANCDTWQWKRNVFVQNCVSGERWQHYGSILLIWLNFNPSMDKRVYAYSSSYLSMLWLKLLAKGPQVSTITVVIHIGIKKQPSELGSDLLITGRQYILKIYSKFKLRLAWFVSCQYVSFPKTIASQHESQKGIALR